MSAADKAKRLAEIVDELAVLDNEKQTLIDEFTRVNAEYQEAARGESVDVQPTGVPDEQPSTLPGETERPAEVEDGSHRTQPDPGPAAK